MIAKIKKHFGDALTPAGAAWLLRIATILLLIKLAFFSNTQVITVWRDDTATRDSLTVLRYQINQLLEQDTILQNKYNESSNYINALPDDSIQRIIADYRARHAAAPASH